MYEKTVPKCTVFYFAKKVPSKMLDFEQSEKWLKMGLFATLTNSKLKKKIIFIGKTGGIGC